LIFTRVKLSSNAASLEAKNTEIENAIKEKYMKFFYMTHPGKIDENGPLSAANLYMNMWSLVKDGHGSSFNFGSSPKCVGNFSHFISVRACR
jgi:hypothetical protein